MYDHNKELHPYKKIDRPCIQKISTDETLITELSNEELKGILRLRI